MPELRVAEPLRLFLPARLRSSGVVAVPHRPTDSLGHVVQSAGVPLVEVGELRVDGQSSDPAARLAASAVVDVLPQPRPQPLGGPARLLLDVHLGTLARRLRLLGVDTAYRNDADDDELVAQAQDEDRLLLTQDRGLLFRRALRRAAYVHGSSPDAQLGDVLDRFPLPLSPYALCTACGGELQPVAKQDVEHLLEPGTRRTQEQFRRCTGCGRVYWHGAHAERLDALVRRSCSSAAERVAAQYPTLQEDLMGSAHTPADDIVYDLVSIQYHALQGADTYAKYLKDAEGHDDVQQFIREVQQQDAQRAERCHALLRDLTKDHGIG